MKKATWIYTGIGAIAAMLALTWAFSPRPVEVEVAKAVVGPFQTTVEEDGKTRLRERYVVSAPLAGLLTRISLREGDPVREGQVVATLMPVLSPLLDERSLREQQARLEVAQANVQRINARIEGAKVALQQARNEAQRSEQLATQGFVSPTKLDNDRLAVLAAQKELEAANEERHVAGHEVDQARAALMAVQRPDGRGARVFELKAPVSGSVLRVTQTSEATVALGTPLIEIGDVSRIEIVAELLTTDALAARPGSPVIVDRWGGEAPLEGKVRLVEPGGFTKVSALGVEEQRVRVLIDITSPPERWRPLGDGYRVGVRIVTSSVGSALKVPVSAVFPAEGGGMAVFVFDGKRARRVPVQLVARNGSDAWVGQGVSAGTQVIVYPPPSVKEGVRVRARGV